MTNVKSVKTVFKYSSSVIITLVYIDVNGYKIDIATSNRALLSNLGDRQYTKYGLPLFRK